MIWDFLETELETEVWPLQMSNEPARRPDGMVLCSGDASEAYFLDYQTEWAAILWTYEFTLGFGSGMYKLPPPT